ncbi:MAG: hypothetical protein ACRD93_04765 [Nitrososphaeraceae archaeon]
MTADSFVKPCSFCGFAIQMVEMDNGRWKAVEANGNAHYCLRNKRGNK